MAIEDENNYGLSGVQVKELVAQVKKRAVSVGEDGSSHVEEADQIYTKTLQLQEAAFVYRTTAGSLSIETGEANLLKLYGKTVQSGHQEEVRDLTYEFANEVTMSVDWPTYEAYHQYFSTTGTLVATYDSSYTNPWRVLTPAGAQTNMNDAAFADAGITFSSSTHQDGDTFTIISQPYVIGTLTTAKPTSFVSTGYNQYNATAGYAHVIGGQEYRIDGTYTSLGFTEEIGGTTTAVTVTNGKFTPESDGYIYVTGGSGNILIALVWSGTRDSDPYVAYSADTISIPTIDIDSASLPTASYGMPSVDNVADELDFEEQLYIQRIGHYAYSTENLETVEALGVDYWYDEEDIFYVLETPITYHLATSVKSAYTANDFGTEEIVGTSVAMPVMISYGNNLVDKLRNLLPIQAIGDKLEMDGTTLNVAQSALGDIGAFKELTEADYNWPENNPAYVLLCIKDVGGYWWRPGVNVKCVASGSASDLIGQTYGGMAIVATKTPNVNGGLCDILAKSSFDYKLYVYLCGNTRTPASSYANMNKYYTDNSNDKTTNFSSYLSTGKIFDAQGAYGLYSQLKCIVKTTPPPTSGAVTDFSQAPIVGQLYYDKTSEKLYICVDATANAYVWKEVTLT